MLQIANLYRGMSGTYCWCRGHVFISSWCEWLLMLVSWARHYFILV